MQVLPDKKYFAIQSVQVVAEPLHFEQGEVHAAQAPELTNCPSGHPQFSPVSTHSVHGLVHAVQASPSKKCAALQLVQTFAAVHSVQEEAHAVQVVPSRNSPLVHPVQVVGEVSHFVQGVWHASHFPAPVT